MDLNKNQIIDTLKTFLGVDRFQHSTFWVAGKVFELANRERVVGTIDYISLYVDSMTFDSLVGEVGYTCNFSKEVTLWIDVDDYPIKLFKEEMSTRNTYVKNRLKSISLSNLDTLFVKSYDDIPIL